MVKRSVGEVDNEGWYFLEMEEARTILNGAAPPPGSGMPTEAARTLPLPPQHQRQAPRRSGQDTR